MTYQKVQGTACPDCGNEETDVALPLMSAHKNLYGCPECGELFEGYIG